MEDENTKLVRRYYAAWNKGDIERIESCVSADLKGRTGALSFDRTTLLAFRRTLTDALAEFAVAEQDAVASGDRVAMRWITRGRTRETNEAVEIHGATFYRIEAGLIAEMWDVRDQPAAPMTPSE